MPTSTDGACSIHSVWGDWVEGALFKSDARSFLRDTFGPTAEDFKTNLGSPELLADLEVALWDLLLPIAKQTVNFGDDSHLGDKEARHVWNTLLRQYPGVAARCLQAGCADEECFRKYRACKDKIIQEFASVCIAGLRSNFIMPLMCSLGMLDKYTTEESFDFVGDKRLSNFDALFMQTAGAHEGKRLLWKKLV